MLRLLFIGFCMLQSPNYVEAIGMQLLLLDWHALVGHPAIELQKSNWRNMNGEDMELGNRHLSNCTKSIRGQTEADSLDRAYRLVGCMLETKSVLHEDLKNYRSMKQWSSNKNIR